MSGVLDQGTINNWNRNTFNRLSDGEVRSTVDKTLGWYDSFLKDTPRDLAPQSWDTLKASRDVLAKMSTDFAPNGFDAAEREVLMEQAYTRTDKAVTYLQENADNARVLAGVTERTPEFAGEQQRIADRINAAPAESAEAPSDTAAAESAPFDGRYTAAEEGALAKVESGDATMGLGDKGPPVTEAQELMLRHGADLEKYGADGYLGPVTEREIKKLQGKWGLEETGKLDKDTMARLRQEPESAPAENAEAAKNGTPEAAKEGPAPEAKEGPAAAAEQAAEETPAEAAKDFRLSSGSQTRLGEVRGELDALGDPPRGGHALRNYNQRKNRLQTELQTLESGQVDRDRITELEGKLENLSIPPGGHAKLQATKRKKNWEAELEQLRTETAPEKPEAKPQEKPAAQPEIVST